MFENLTHIPYLAGLLSWFKGEPASAYSILGLVFKWAEVVMSIGAAYATRMIPLRFMAMFGNVFGLAQGLGSGSISTIVEHAVNLPLNATRVREMRKLPREEDVDIAILRRHKIPIEPPEGSQ